MHTGRGAGRGLSRLRPSAAAGDSGAVAVLVVLVVLFLGVPASALGLTAFVRSSALAELQQVADAAALAGASSIPLADLDYALAYADAVGASVTGPADVDLPPLQSSLGPAVVRPLENACAQARTSAGSLGFRGQFALPPTRPGRTDDAYVVSCAGDPTVPGNSAPVPNTGPSAVDGFARVKYFQDLNVVTELGRCLDAAERSLPTLPAGLDGTLPVSRLVRTLQGLSQAAPVLLNPGVVVQVRQDVRGPLDQLLSSGATTSTQVVTARARRRPKNLVVLPYDDRLLAFRPASAVASGSAQLAAALQGTADLLRALPTSLPVPAPPALPEPLPPLPGLPPEVPSLPGSVPLPTAALRDCATVIDAVLDDYDDLVAPTDANSAEDTLRRAAAGGEPVTVVLLGPSATFLDTLQVCLPVDAVQSGTSVQAPDEDGDGVPDRVEVGGSVRLQLDVDEVVQGVRCQPGTPGSFRATLVRD